MPFNKYSLKPVKDTLIASSILVIPRMFYRGVILYFCWMWFALPYGLPPLDYWTATVIGGIISTLTFEHIGESKDARLAYKKMVEWTIGISAFFLVAFLLHVWIH